RKDEIAGKHHRIFVDSREVGGDYSAFWESLRGGRADIGEVRRLTKDGSDVWLRACYLPVRNSSGSVDRVIKYAIDYTDERRDWVRATSERDAVNETFAVIAFDLDGTIRDANQNFLGAMGYRADEVVGKHHRMFVTPEYAASDEYAEFWTILGRGQHHSGEFHRVTKSGDDIWIQASYNPLRDPAGEITGVVKYATDITDTVRMREASDAVARKVSSGSTLLVENISHISEKVGSTADRAQSAESQSKLVAESVEELNECSKAIEEVVEVIRGLADQTKLLSLNASIEAARAGEAGKGFAVVASEVKELAAQTAAATKNIESSVGDIRNTIKRTVESTNGIQTSIRDVTSNVEGIASAIDEQSSTVQELNEAASKLA
ncbi:MAG: methyl-accepting chemotaxis protein, partial [Pseudomonadota bacterium]